MLFKRNVISKNIIHSFSWTQRKTNTMNNTHLSTIYLIIISNTTAFLLKNEERTTTETSKRFICPSACYAYNHGTAHSHPRVDIWCRCSAAAMSMGRRELAQQPMITGKPPFLDSDVEGSSIFKTLVSNKLWFFLKKKWRNFQKNEKLASNFSVSSTQKITSQTIDHICMSNFMQIKLNSQLRSMVHLPHTVLHSITWIRQEITIISRRLLEWSARHGTNWSSTHR